MNNIEINLASVNDVPALEILINDAYRTDNPNAWTTEAHLFHENGIRMSESELVDTFSKSENVILKAILNNEIIVGTVCLTKKENKVYLGTFAVSGNHQGNGIGKKLILASIDFAKEWNKEFITITVISVRAELIHWYEKIGFEKTGKLIPFQEERAEHQPLSPLNFIEMKYKV